MCPPAKKTVEIEKDIMYNAINLGINTEALPDKKRKERYPI